MSENRRDHSRGFGEPEPSASERHLRFGSTCAALNDLSVGLARHPDVISFARQLIDGRRERLGRITTVFSFVSQLVDVPPRLTSEIVDGVDELLRLTGMESGPAVIVSALLRALGERARVECVAGMAFVRVELDEQDVARLPPHARPSVARGRYYLPLDARGARSPMGFLPLPIRCELQRNRAALELMSRTMLLRRRRRWHRI